VNSLLVPAPATVQITLLQVFLQWPEAVKVATVIAKSINPKNLSLH
jgi:endonuclease V-like protein UPF0215 family